LFTLVVYATFIDKAHQWNIEHMKGALEKYYAKGRNVGVTAFTCMDGSALQD